MPEQSTITPKNLRDILRRTIPAGLSTMTVGAPGIGKTDIHCQVASELGYEMVVLYPAILDPTDIGGLPIPVGPPEHRRVERLLDDTLHAVILARKPTLLLLDELGQSSPAMQAACAPIILARKLGKYCLPNHVTISAATNRVSDRAGASGILTHIISRMATVLHLAPDFDSWTEWAVTNKLHHGVTSLIRWRPALLNNFDGAKAAQVIAPYPCPRSWRHASDILALGLDEATQCQALEGAVGAGAATELTAHLRASANIDLDEIMTHPAKLKLPGNIGTQIAIVSGLALRATKENAAAIIELAKRLRDMKRGEYMALLLRDALLACPHIYMAHPWAEAMSGEMGKEIVNI